MIRYATSADVEWIVSIMQANTDVCHFVPSTDEILGNIEKKQYKISVDDETGARCAFYRFIVNADHIHSMLLLTDEAYREQGHARRLIYYTRREHNNLPIRYYVEADSEQEQVWAFRSDAAKNRNKFVSEYTSPTNGIKFNIYESVMTDEELIAADEFDAAKAAEVSNG